MLTRESALQKVSKRSPTGTETRLTVAPGVLPDETVRRIIDDCLVPAMVETFLYRKQTASNQEERQHNGKQQP